MYLEYFGLKQHPFRITPDTTLFCPGSGRGEILEALVYAITSGEGIVKVVGEVGTGKTMLCRMLEERLPGSVEIVYLANPKLAPHDIPYAIAFELKLAVRPETERVAVMQHLQDYLLQQHGANRNVVVFIEEAQGMPLETLEEIRLLSNLETHQQKLLQIVLFGQPELEKKLRKAEIRQLRERITHSFYLSPLNKTETSEYIRFRLQGAGCKQSGVFSPEAERLIGKVSRGLIRRINILADKAMLAAYADPVVKGGVFEEGMVQAGHVRAAIRDSEMRMPFFRSPWVAGTGLIFLLVVLAHIWAGNRLSLREEASFFGTTDITSRPAAGVAEPGEVNRVAEKIMQGKDVQEKPVDPGKVVGETVQGDSRPASLVAIQASENRQIELLESEFLRQDMAAISDETLMGQRCKAGGQWLQRVDPANYTIQLMAIEMGSEGNVDRFLLQISPVSLLDQIYVYKRAYGQHHRWVVVYGDFPSVASARQAIDALPSGLRKFQPFVRRLDMARQVGNQ